MKITSQTDLPTHSVVESFDSPIETPFTLVTFSVQSQHPIVIDGNDLGVLYFKVTERAIAADYHCGLDLVNGSFGRPIVYDDHVSSDLEREIEAVRRSLVRHAIKQAISWLCHHFTGAQVIPIETMHKSQIVHAIDAHYGGGWSQLVKDCLGETKKDDV
jgi:hypothetical protein